MIINRHNYEEFFLLYVDNELCAADRAAVEAFVDQNADLKSELAMLQQTTLTTDENLLFDGKALLMKSGNEINLANYEEYFLMHVDDELRPNEKNEVERFVLQHPNLQNEFILLQQTKLSPEQVFFENKKSLYRNTQKRVVPVYLMRMAVAAVFIGLAIFLYVLIPSENLTTPGNKTFAANPTSEPKKNDIPVSSLPKTDSYTQPAAEPTKQQHITEEKVAKATYKVRKHTSEQTFALNKSLDAKQEPVKTFTAVENGTGHVVVEPEKNINTQELAAIVPGKTTTDNIIRQAVTKKPDEPIAKQAVYKELDTRIEDDDNSILFGSTQINKNKLRGLFKKASKLFDKNDEKRAEEKPIQIASFEIKGK